MLKGIESLPPDNDPTTNKLVKLKMLKPALKTFRKRVNTLMKQLEAETRKVTEIRNRENASRAQIRTQLSISIGLDVVLALAMLFIFMRNLNSRLAQLIDNAKAVPTADNLPHKIAGADELSYLDLILHTAVNDLQAAQKHRAAVTAMVAHDLRTPLMSVRLVADGLSKTPEISGSEPLSKKVKSLNVNIRRVFSLVEDLLTIERLEAGKLELKLDLVEMRVIVEEAFQTVEDTAQSKSITLVNEISSCEIVADKDRVTQVLLNYLSNAIKFSPEGGKITVAAVIEPKDVIVKVSDQGKGIAAADREQLFTKFYQTAEGKSHRGFGLGLAICKLLIAEHGGDVGVESAPGEGSTFWFKLPNDEDLEV